MKAGILSASLAVLLLLWSSTSTAATIIITVAGNGEEGFSGDDGPATEARLHGPMGIAVDDSGNIFIADSQNHRIRRVDAKTRIMTTIAGNGKAGFSGDGGKAIEASLNEPNSVAVDTSGNVFIADLCNHRVRKVDGKTGIITTVIGDGFGTLQKGRFAGDGALATSASLFFPMDVAFDNKGNLVVADVRNHRIRMVDKATSIIQTIAGNGNGEYGNDGSNALDASFQFPAGIFYDTAGNMFIADTQNHRIRKIDVDTGIVRTVAGNGHPCLPDPEPTAMGWQFTAAKFSEDGIAATDSTIPEPTAVAVDKAGILYFTDQAHGGRIRKVGPDGKISTIAGGGKDDGEGVNPTAALIRYASDIVIDSKGNIYIVETGRSRVRVIRPDVEKGDF